MYFHLTLLSILSLFSVNRSIDWWDVLSTDLSCCSTHSNAQDCSNEGANACSFVDDSVTCAPGKAGQECRFKQRLADEFGACLQESFIACKVAAGKINACCAPGCKGIDPPAGPPPVGEPPASGVAPVCFPKVTPAPTTPAPVTPSPTTPRPTTPSPTTPSPTTPAPVTPAPVTPAPVTPAPVTPSPVTPSPTTPSPITPAPVTPAPVTPAPVTPAPVTPAPVTPAPVTPAPVTPAPVTPSPVTPSPVTPSPVTPSPVTPSPVTPSPVTPSPVTTTTTTGGEENPGGPNDGNDGSTGDRHNDPNDNAVCEHMGAGDSAYAFEGMGCQISGDPHFIMFNGFVHDFMGQPSREMNNKPMDQFYYVTQCYGRSTAMMPFRIIGRQYNLWETVSGLDYLVFELFDQGTDSGDTYYLFLSPDFQAFAKKGDNGVSTYYDDIPDGSLTDIAAGSATTIGTRFTVEFSETGTAYNAVDLTLAINQDDGNTYTNLISISCQSKDDLRCRQTYANIRLASYYKCRACGLCGDFIKTKVEGTDVKQPIEACDGTDAQIGYGSDASKTPEAFDINGLTYERNYWLTTPCVNSGFENGGFTYTSPCDESDAFKLAIKQECIKRTHVWADCCREVSEECTAMQKDCNWDTCVMATENGVGNTALIEEKAKQAFDNAMEKLCTLPQDSNAIDPYENCQLEYAQCGGIGFTGETCCKQGFKCQYSSDYWSACVQDPDATDGCSAAWQQCGGKQWVADGNPTCCNHGYVCIWDTDFYSQCLPVENAAHSHKNKDDSQFMVAIDSMNIQLNDTFHTVDMDYFKIGGITFGILSVLVMIYLYKKKQESKDGDYIAIDDQKYGEIIPNYRSVV